MEYLHPQSPTSAGKQPTWPREHKQAVKYTKRFDSGVADVGSDSEVVIRPMAATGEGALEYDYARGSHVYEDMPPKYVPGSEESILRERTGPIPVESSSWPSTISTSNTQLSTTTNNNNTEDSIRKRHNPLYDAVQKKHPGPPRPDSAVISPHYIESSQRIICVCAAAGLIIAIISFVIAIYIVVTITPEKYAETNQAHYAQYQQLKTDFDDLSKKYTLLSNLLLGELTEGNSSGIPLAVLVARNKMVLQTLRLNLTGQQGEVENLKSQVTVISDLNQELRSQKGSISENSGLINMAIRNISLISRNMIGLEESVRNVSKMEGPQGPQGVGNLSACYYINHRKILPNAGADATRTSRQPSLDILQDFVVMSATCSVTGGTATSLETSPVDSIANAFQYRCQCAGTDSNIQDRTCYLHLWLCPRLS